MTRKQAHHDGSHSHVASQHRDTPAAAPLVVKIGGAALDDPSQTPWLWEALCELHHGRAGGIVLVHGGAKAIDRKLKRLGFTTERREGLRLTPPEQIDEIVAVLAGSVNKALVGWVQRFGVPAVGLCLGDGLSIRTAKTTRFDFDPGRVGEVTGGHPRLIATLLGAGFMPVLCSIGLDEHGSPLNVNADEAAAGVASVIDAAEMIFLTDVPGVLNAQGGVYEDLDAAQIEASIASGEIHGGMIPKVRGALQAANEAGVPATIASWNGPGDLLKLARGERAGTRIWPADRGAAEFSFPQPQVTPAARLRPAAAVSASA